MKNLNITVDNKVATYLQRDGEIVCGNSDYQIIFTFDADWDAYETKTARFIWNGKHMDVPFEGNECQVPTIKNTDEVKVGVYAGDISTTTPAIIPCKRSVLCGDEEMYEGNPEVCRDQAIDAAERAEAAAAESGKAVAKALAKMTTQEAGESETLVMSQKAVTDLVADALGNDTPTYETVSSVEEMTDTTKQYVLASTGTIWTFGEVETEGKRYTNLYDAETMATADYLNMRINSSGAYTSGTGHASTPYIPYQITAGTTLTIRIKGAPQQTSAHGYARIMAYPTDTSISPINDTPAGNIPANFSVGTLEGDGVYAYSKTITTDANYLRFVIYMKDGEVTADDVKDFIITANEVIDDTPLIITETKWYDTMLTPETAGSGGGNYVTLLTKINDHTAQIAELDHRMAAVESDSGTFTIPSYWEETVKEKIGTVKALQDAGGKDCVCFAWAADTHIPDNSGGWTNALGRLMAKMMDDCEIPFAVLSGDIGTQSSQSTEAKLIETQKYIPQHLAPLWGTDRLIMALGNHDGVWGEGSSTNVSGYYSQRLTQEKMWQLYFRGQALDFRREFSDNGLYFYVDSKAQKTRFIVLNSHFAADYTEGRNIYNVSCYGQAQLDWLSDVALDMPEGYGAVITTHVPPKIVHDASTEYTVDHAQLKGIINAYNNKTTFSGSYTAGTDGWSNSTVNVDFTDAKGEVIALFAGHIHEDTVDTETMACPLMTITTAGSKVYNGSLSRTQGTATETSFDVVAINRATKTIYCTRVGAGDDREISY